MNKREAFAVLFATWPRHDSEPPVNNLMKAFETSCLYADPWAVEKAVKRFITGNVNSHNMSFRPSPPQIAQLATSIQAEEKRIDEIGDRIRQQTRQIEYQRAPKEQRDMGVKLWQRIRHELSKANIAELSQAYIVHGLSVPGTIFDVNGAHFPDGTRHSIEQMCRNVNFPEPNTLDHLDWQESLDEQTRT